MSTTTLEELQTRTRKLAAIRRELKHDKSSAAYRKADREWAAAISEAATADRQARLEARATAGSSGWGPGRPRS